MKFLGWILFATLFSTISAGADDSAPVKIEAGLAQLFIDDYLIDSQENLERTLHQPTKDHGGNIPIIALPQDAFGELPATLEANGSIVYDPNLKKMVMYALAFCSSLGDDRRWEKVRLYRFTSDDGLSWSDSEWVFPRSREDFLNRETGEYATNIDLFSCYYDDKDTDYPYKGLCWFANWGLKGEGSYLLKSKDGILWERGPLIVDGCGGEGDTSMREIHQDGRTLVGAGDVTLVYKDPLRDRLLGIFKFTSPTTVENGNRTCGGDDTLGQSSWRRHLGVCGRLSHGCGKLPGCISHEQGNEPLLEPRHSGLDLFWNWGGDRQSNQSLWLASAFFDLRDDVPEMAH
ncbi:MAG: hypothetical protein KC917_04380 [Candidatus Omnitrophica bacterium]|nr:hypothetical protein [Candidatus Omnitrophota bacterium]